MIPADIRTLADYEAQAAAHIAPAHWPYIQDGTGDNLTRDDNRAAYDRVKLLPRLLADLRGGSTAMDLFGRRHAAPILLAPIAYQRLVHDDGELATVRAATAVGTGFIASTLSSVTLEEIARAAHDAARELDAPPAPLWFQLYSQEQPADSLTLIRRAEAAGYEALVLTVDASIKRTTLRSASGHRGGESARHVAPRSGGSTWRPHPVRNAACRCRAALGRRRLAARADLASRSS